MITTAAAIELRTTPPTGRLERAMREKVPRILEAASTLFDQRDFHHVVTLEISERAVGIEEPTGAVVALTSPVLAESSKHARNAAAYQRGALFGSPTRSSGPGAWPSSRASRRRSPSGWPRGHEPRPRHIGYRSRRRDGGARPSGRMPPAARSAFALLHLLLAHASTAARDASWSSTRRCAKSSADSSPPRSPHL